MSREADSPSVLFVNHFALPPDAGGGTRHFELARALAELGWRVEIAASDFHYQSRSYGRRAGPHDQRAIVEDIDGVRFNWLWSAPYSRNNWRRLRNWLSFVRSLGRWARSSSRVDVVVGSSPHLFAAVAAAGVARRWGVPFVLELRDLWPESILAAGGRRGAFYGILGMLARKAYRRATGIVVLAKGVEGYLRNKGVTAPMVYVPNGVDTSQFDHYSNGGGSKKATLVYAGAHGPANGLEVILEAAEVLQDRCEAKFLLVGDGPAKPALQAQARGQGLANVSFADPVPKKEMPALLARAAAGLMLLRDAPLFRFAVSPNKLFDYLAAGLPVVCNVEGEVAEMVADAGAGVQTSDASGAALADAIQRLLQLPEPERAMMGERGREWVRRGHDRQVLAQRLDRFLRDLALSADLG